MITTCRSITFLLLLVGAKCLKKTNPVEDKYAETVKKLIATNPYIPSSYPNFTAADIAIDKSERKFLNWNLPTCDLNGPPNSYFHITSDGKIHHHAVRTPSSRCFYRCVDYVTEHVSRFRKWENVRGVAPDCENYDIECRVLGVIKFKDRFIRFRKMETFPQYNVTFTNANYSIEPIKNSYDVYFFIIDSVSKFSSERALKKSVNYFVKQFDGVSMDRLNKVAENSLPNAHAFHLGRRFFETFDIEKGRPKVDSDYHPSTGCRTNLDDKGFINFIYKERKYVTLSTEDYYWSVYHKDGCKGFTRRHADHLSQPWQNRYGMFGNHDGLFGSGFFGRCRWTHHVQLEYFQDYIRAYKNERKFASLWMTRLSHMALDRQSIADGRMKKFFETNKSYLDNAFVFYMSDHGFRIGEYAATHIGEYENDNPFMAMSVPKALRSNEQLMNNLRENSKKHVSHFDTYATLIDIVTEGDRTNFTQLDELDMSTVLNRSSTGQSLLRPINETNRDCYSMGISWQHCLKKLKFRKLEHPSKQTVVTLQNTMASYINLFLKKANLLSRCHKIYINRKKLFKIEYTISEKRELFWKVYGWTTPGDGLFTAVFNEKLELILENMFRINHYEAASKCLPYSIYKQYCTCKDSAAYYLRDAKRKQDAKLG
uniref:Sulfatase domain-containing protein n=2 Tax=Rhabditophanes sp. KR3021 TaxID=114890 RepID=A0AC35TI04_9BILA